MNLRVWFSSSLAVGITMFLVGLMFHVLGAYIAPGLELQYKNRDLFRDWNAWTSTYMVIHPFVYASVFSAVFLRLQAAVSLPADIRGSLMYGAGVFCVGSLPVFLLVFASFRVPVEVIAAWVVQSFCQYLAAGIAVGIVADRMAMHRSDASANEFHAFKINASKTSRHQNSWATCFALHLHLRVFLGDASSENTRSPLRNPHKSRAYGDVLRSGVYSNS